MNEIIYPSITSYLNVNLYLQDVYQFRKKAEEFFSYDVWAQELGISSKSYLRFAILGKRNLSESLAQKLCDSLTLNASEKEYFLLLVLYTQSTQPEQKKLYGRKLTQMIRDQVSMTVIDPSDTLLSNPLHLMIRNILTYPDIPKKIDFISRVFNISAAETTEILRKLEAAQMVQLVGDQWESIHDDIKVIDKPKNESIRQYHKLSLNYAIQAQQLSPEVRHFRSLGLPLSEDEYKLYLDDLDSFAKNMYAKYSPDTAMNRRFYQMNFNLFPWTEKIVE